MQFKIVLDAYRMY